MALPVPKSSSFKQRENNELQDQGDMLKIFLKGTEGDHRAQTEAGFSGFSQALANGSNPN